MSEAIIIVVSDFYAKCLLHRIDFFLFFRVLPDFNCSLHNLSCSVSKSGSCPLRLLEK